MALTQNRAMYSMYVIGGIESNWTWTACYRADPITIGMMQNYAYNARDLLQMLREGASDGWGAFAAGAPRLADALDAGHSDSWWTGVYVTDAEQSAWYEYATTDSNHKVQQRKWLENDVPAMESRLSSWGATVEGMGAPAFVMLMSVYHQSPQSALDIIRTVGGSASLDSVYYAALNHPVVGQYTNRQNEAWGYLRGWDGESAPPDFGQVDLGGGGNAQTGGDDPKQDYGYIMKFGDVLWLFGSGALSDGIPFYPAAGQRWISSVSQTNVDPSPSPPTGEGGGARDSVDGRLQWPSDTAQWTTYAGHLGIDIPAPQGSGTYAAADGIVVYSGSNYHWSYGNYIRVYHPKLGLQTGYAHGYENLVSAGQTVKKGQLIQRVGSTGNSTGPHLHFEIWNIDSENPYAPGTHTDAEGFKNYFDMG